jgi:hypothetical protein
MGPKNVTIQFYKIEDGPPPLTVAERGVRQAEIDEAFAHRPRMKCSTSINASYNISPEGKPP